MVQLVNTIVSEFAYIVFDDDLQANTSYVN